MKNNLLSLAIFFLFFPFCAFGTTIANADEEIIDMITLDPDYFCSRLDRYECIAERDCDWNSSRHVCEPGSRDFYRECCSIHDRYRCERDRDCRWDYRERRCKQERRHFFDK
ncbi:MAG: hypothetical protein HQK50_17610 [Oligoflexia bacterium]|nr:hypothetical protein [Oligoflexia bacterium]MBF0367396.1 hypothetical protein [Oligoflexia bacterium]